jgi:LysR family hydrogen peroxide-inducible transcriptional activator
VKLGIIPTIMLFVPMFLKLKKNIRVKLIIEELNTDEIITKTK